MSLSVGSTSCISIFTFPPQDIPIPDQLSSPRLNSSTLVLPSSNTFLADLTMYLSTQPPPTVPQVGPSSVIAIEAPPPCGADPSASMTVATTTLFPSPSFFPTKL